MSKKTKQYPNILKLLDYKTENGLLNSFDCETLLGYKNPHWNTIEKSLKSIFDFIDKYQYSLSHYGKIKLVTSKEIGYVNDDFIGLIFQFHHDNKSYLWNTALMPDWLKSVKFEKSITSNVDDVKNFVQNNGQSGVVPLWFGNVLSGNDLKIDDLMKTFQTLFIDSNKKVINVFPNYAEQLTVQKNFIDYCSFALNETDKQDLIKSLKDMENETVLILSHYDNISLFNSEIVNERFNSLSKEIQKAESEKQLVTKQIVCQRLIEVIHGYMNDSSCFHAIQHLSKVVNSHLFYDFSMDYVNDMIKLNVTTSAKHSLLLALDIINKNLNDNVLDINQLLLNKGKFFVFQDEVQTMLNYVLNLNNSKHINLSFFFKRENNEIKMIFDDTSMAYKLFDLALKLSRKTMTNKYLFNLSDFNFNIPNLHLRITQSYLKQCQDYFSNKEDLTLFDVITALSNENDNCLMRLNENFNKPLLHYYGFSFKIKQNNSNNVVLKDICNMKLNFNAVVLNALREVPVKFDRFHPAINELNGFPTVQSVFIIDQEKLNTVKVVQHDKVEPLSFALNIKYQ